MWRLVDNLVRKPDVIQLVSFCDGRYFRKRTLNSLHEESVVLFDWSTDEKDLIG
jgi:hypothetical protein